MVSFKFFIYEKNDAFISFGRDSEDRFICFWFSNPGDVAFLSLLVRLATGRPPLNLISKPLKI
jgi:hypothetical protein